MADWPFGGAISRADTYGDTAASSSGTTLTAGSANTKGSYTELVASTAFDACCIAIAHGVSPDSGDLLIDIAIGTAGSEQVIIPNIHSNAGGSIAGFIWSPLFPISIPAGSRIAARCQAATGSQTVLVEVMIFSHTFMAGGAPGRWIDIGTNTADSGGTDVDPGGSANTKGAYSELVASLSSDIQGFALNFGNRVNTARTSCFWLVDFAIGGAGSEKIVIPDFLVRGHVSSDDVYPMWSPFIPMAIPAGTRIAARAQCSITDATDRLIEVMMYGA